MFDNAASTFGANLYAYCLNNPVMYVDPSGYGPVLDFFSGVLMGIADSAKALYNAVIHIDQTIMNIINNPLGALQSMGEFVWNLSAIVMVQNLVNAAQTGNWYGFGHYLGGATFDALSIAATYGVASGIKLGAKAMKAAKANKILDAILKNPSLVQKLSIKKFNSIAKNAGKPWSYGPTKNGKGMRIYNKSNMIMYNYGASGAMHNFGGYYWKVSNGLPGSPFRFPFL